MMRANRRTMLGSLGALTTAGLAGCLGDDEEPDDHDDSADDHDADSADDHDDEPETAQVRVGHFSPDAPNVDVWIDGDDVLTDVAFATVSDYLEVSAAELDVEITAAGDPETVVYDDTLSPAADSYYTVAATGELEGDVEFAVEVFEDDHTLPDDDESTVRVVHLSPDAPAVDITVADDDTVLFEDVEFGEYGYQTVPAGEYTIEIRGATADADGDVVAEFDLDLEGSTVASAFAIGYLEPDAAAGDEPFDLVVTADAA